MNRKLISSDPPSRPRSATAAPSSRAIGSSSPERPDSTTGRMTIADDLEHQTEQCLKNIEAALLQAGSSLADVVRVTYVLPDATSFLSAGRCFASTSARCVRPP